MVHIFMHLLPDLGSEIRVGEALHATAGLRVGSAGPVQSGPMIDTTLCLSLSRGVGLSYMVHNDYLTRSE